MTHGNQTDWLELLSPRSFTFPTHLNRKSQYEDINAKPAEEESQKVR